VANWMCPGGNVEVVGKVMGKWCEFGSRGESGQPIRCAQV
jgi:hypothetical protein